MKKLLLTLLIASPGLYAMDEHYTKELADVKHCDTVAAEHSAPIIARDSGISLERAAQIPTGVQEHIWDYKTATNKLFVAKHMEKLLPAVYHRETLNGADFFDLVAHHEAYEAPVFDLIARYKTANNERLTELTDDGVVLPDSTVDPRLYLHTTLRRIKHYDISDGYRTTETSTPGLPTLARTREPLNIQPDELCALCYTNGKTIFKVDDATRAKLEKLSRTQLNFLLYLHDLREYGLRERNSDDINLSDDELALFHALPSTIKSALKTNYTLSNVTTYKDIIKKAACKALTYTASVAVFAGLIASRVYSYR